MPAWITQPNGKLKCEHHPEVKAFAAGQVCSACKLNPPPPVEVEDQIPPPSAPKGCVSTEDHEREFTQLAKLAESLAIAASKDIDPKHSSIAKMLDAAAKARNSATKLATAREARYYHQKLRELDPGYDAEDDDSN